MGGSNSKAVTNLAIEIINQVSVKVSAEYQTSITQNQNIALTNSGFSLISRAKLKQTSTIEAKYVVNSVFTAKLQNELFNKLSTSATTQGIAILDAFGKTKSSAETNLKQTIKNVVDVSTIMKTVTAIEQGQSFSFNNTGVQIYASLEAIQGAEIFAQATLQAFTDAGVFTDMKNEIESKAETKTTNPLAFIGDFLTSMGKMPFYIAGLIGVLITIIVVAGRLRGRARIRPDPNYPNSYRPESNNIFTTEPPLTRSSRVVE